MTWPIIAEPKDPDGNGFSSGRGVGVSGNNNWVVVADQDSYQTAIIDTGDWSYETHFDINDSNPQDADFSPNNDFVATCSFVNPTQSASDNYGNVIIYDVPGWSEQIKFNHAGTSNPGYSITNVIFSEDGQYLAYNAYSTDDDYNLQDSYSYIVEVGTWNLVKSFHWTSDIPDNQVFSYDNNYLAFTMGGNIEVYEVGSWNHQATLTDAGTESICFDPNNRYLAGAADGKNTIYEQGTWNKVSEFSVGIGSTIYDAEFSYGGRSLVLTSISDDKTVVVDTGSWTKEAEWAIGFEQLDFAKDDEFLFAGGDRDHTTPTVYEVKEGVPARAQIDVLLDKVNNKYGKIAVLDDSADLDSGVEAIYDILIDSNNNEYGYIAIYEDGFDFSNENIEAQVDVLLNKNQNKYGKIAIFNDNADMTNLPAG